MDKVSANLPSSGTKWNNDAMQVERSSFMPKSYRQNSILPRKKRSRISGRGVSETFNARTKTYRKNKSYRQTQHHLAPQEWQMQRVELQRCRWDLHRRNQSILSHSVIFTFLTPVVHTYVLHLVHAYCLINLFSHLYLTPRACIVQEAYCLIK